MIALKKRKERTVRMRAARAAREARGLSPMPPQLRAQIEAQRATTPSPPDMQENIRVARRNRRAHLLSAPPYHRYHPLYQEQMGIKGEARSAMTLARLGGVPTKTKQTYGRQTSNQQTNALIMNMAGTSGGRKKKYRKKTRKKTRKKKRKKKRKTKRKTKKSRVKSKRNH